MSSAISTPIKEFSIHCNGFEKISNETQMYHSHHTIQDSKKQTFINWFRAYTYPEKCPG